MRLLRRVRLRRPWRAKDPLHRRKPAVAPSPGGDLPSPVAASRGQINHPRFFRHDPRGCSSHGSAPIVRRKTSFFSVLGDWQHDGAPACCRRPRDPDRFIFFGLARGVTTGPQGNSDHQTLFPIRDLTHRPGAAPPTGNSASSPFWRKKVWHSVGQVASLNSRLAATEGPAHGRFCPFLSLQHCSRRGPPSPGSFFGKGHGTQLGIVPHDRDKPLMAIHPVRLTKCQVFHRCPGRQGVRSSINAGAPPQKT